MANKRLKEAKSDSKRLHANESDRALWLVCLQFAILLYIPLYFFMLHFAIICYILLHSATPCCHFATFGYSMLPFAQVGYIILHLVSFCSSLLHPAAFCYVWLHLVLPDSTFVIILLLVATVSFLHHSATIDYAAKRDSERLQAIESDWLCLHCRFRAKSGRARRWKDRAPLFP